MVCPSCQSENTQRLSMVFEQGTSQINTTSKTKVRPAFGLLPVASAKTQTSGVAMSTTAQKAAPPQKHAYKTPALAILVGIAVLLFAGSNWVLWAVGIAIIALFAWVLYTGIRYNTKTWPTDREAWEKKWMCNKCGVVYSE